MPRIGSMDDVAWSTPLCSFLLDYYPVVNYYNSYPARDKNQLQIFFSMATLLRRSQLTVKARDNQKTIEKVMLTG
jgi:hypothetical protein